MREREVHILQNGGWDSRVIAFQYSDIVTTFAVVTRRYLVVIDTLLNPGMAASAIRQVSEDLKGRRLLVINTHADWDHAWGNACFVGQNAAHPAPIIGHRLCRTRLESEEERRTLERMLGEDPDLYRGVTLVAPTVTVEHALEIHGGDLTLHLFRTPGHKPDHLSVFIPEISMLFPGDAAEYPLPFVESGRTLGQMVDSLAQMKSLNPKRVLCCHAPGRTDISVIDLNIAYFDELRRRARAARLLPELPPTATDLDLASAMGFTWETASALFEFITPQQEFYRGAHVAAIRAAVDELRLA